ncbi:MAG TPA: Lrp/AsnC ligand binding domain-containing protein [Bacteroidia bacterium]|nr:AsnC family transcriptional regulator [Sphingobacteriales bacterium]HPD64624.1 Lrp/AsnC ligand binding domain-containing protein [Bacteroidia bacterium]HRS58494.1 Lrp/AsnC ligand binding domain-containing protein [Bacteroidia bacterium]HRU68375.1 Lrp/AsnC ligand binding domain-containing protein [Bacteroidia bacterium]
MNHQNQTFGFQPDNTDVKILNLLMKDARMPFTQIAKKCRISGAAVHQRFQKLRQTGIISGSTVTISPKSMGYMTCAFIGIQVNLTTSTTHDQVFQKISEIAEIVECHHITGKYSLLVKIFAKNNEHLKKIIVEKIQSVPEIISTETFISLEEGFIRALPV